MKAYVFLCVVALLAAASADYSFEVITSTQDSVIFEYDCDGNGECVEPGEEYCGDSQVKSVLCLDGGRCQVDCQPLKTRSVKDDWPSTFTVMPKKKKASEPFELIVKDTRNSKPVVCDVEIYYGGRMESEQLTGATHWGGTVTVVSAFTKTRYIDGVLVETTHTDRQGILTYTPDKPGYYALRLLNSYVMFAVSDEAGNVYECGDGECNTTLGEDASVCPGDCEEVPPEDESICGDGVCELDENKMNCPADCVLNTGVMIECIPEGRSVGIYPGAPDCCAGLVRVGCEAPQGDGSCLAEPCVGSVFCANCGDNNCGPGENYCNCPADCAQPQQAQVSQGGNNMALVVIILAVVIIGAFVVVALFKSGKLKKNPAAPKKKKSDNQPTERPNTCPKCGAPIGPDDIFCTRCGYRI
mgnify:CR=1 FL=1